VSVSDQHCGGSTYDDRLLAHVLHRSYRLTGRNIAHNLSALGLLSQSAELTKRALSTDLSASITVDLTDNAALSLVVTRQEFEALNLDLFEQTLAPIDSALARANSLGLNIDQVRPPLQQCAISLLTIS